jgi:hypothetical protein
MCNGMIDTEITDVIKIKIPENSFIIDLETDKLYWNGQRILTTEAIRKYEYSHKKENNTLFNHRRIVEIKDYKNLLVFVIDIGYDGRLFFMLFDKNYGNFRAEPIHKLSYWHDRKEKTKKWYDQDMINPVQIWNTNILA